MTPKLILKNLPQNFGRTQIAKWLSVSANPITVSVLTHEKTDQSTGEALAEFSTVIEAAKVLELLHKSSLKDHEVDISWYDEDKK